MQQPETTQMRLKRSEDRSVVLISQICSSGMRTSYRKTVPVWGVFFRPSDNSLFTNTVLRNAQFCIRHLTHAVLLCKINKIK